MALPAASVVVHGATQILSSEIATNLAKRFGGAVYERIFASKTAPVVDQTLEALSLDLSTKPSKAELEQAFEVLETRLLSEIGRAFASERRLVIAGGSTVIFLQVVMFVVLLLQ